MSAAEMTSNPPPASSSHPTTTADFDWSWLDREDERETVDLSRTTVTAVLVAHNGEEWLPAALHGLQSQTVRPSAVIAVDAGSTDATPELLQAARADGIVDEIRTGSDAGFGLAVAEGLESEPAPSDWIWLLHDDAVPGPEALAELLTAALTEGRTADLLGPMLLRPNQAGRPAEITGFGESLSNSARRDTGLEPGEIDQHQRGSREVLGLSTCGLLVRRRVFDELDGLDSELGLFRDGVAFGWRANLAGHRALAVPTAKITHLQAGHAGLRDSWVIGDHPRATERALSMIVVNSHRSGLAAVGSSIRLVLACVLRSLGYLLGKDPSAAADEWRAARHYLGSREIVTALRERSGEDSASSSDRQRTRSLRPARFAALGLAVDSAGRAIGRRWRALAGEGASSSLDELTGDAYSDHGDNARPAWQNPTAITFALLIGLSLVAGRLLIGPGLLTGPYLLPSQPDLSAAFDAYLEPIPGAPFQAASPWIGLTALASLVTVGQPELLITVLVFGSVGLAFLSAWLLAKRLFSSRLVRWLAPLAYGLLLPMLGVLNQASVATVVVAVLLPALGAAGHDLISADERLRERPDSRRIDAFRPAFAGGLVLLVLTTVVPSLFLLGVLGAAILCWLAPQTWRRVLVALGIPLILLFPWIPSLLVFPGRFFTGPDAAQALSAEGGFDPSVLLGQLAGGSPWWLGAVFFGLLWLAALIGSLLRFSTAVAVGWLLSVVGIAMAVLLAGAVVAVGPTGDQARPEALVWLFVGFAGALVAGAAGLAGAFGGLARSDGGRRAAGGAYPIGGVAAKITLTVVAVGLLAGSGWWLVGSMTGPVDRRAGSALPAFITNAMQSDAGVRTLSLDLRGEQVRWALLEDAGYRLGSADRGYVFGADPQFEALTASVTARLLAGSDDALLSDLNQLGVAYLWVQGGSEEQLAQIGNVPGLGTGSSDEVARIWTVPSSAARAEVISGEVSVPVGRAGAEILPGDQDRVLVLAEPADPRWQAFLDGAELAPVQGDNGRPTFAVGAAGGQLSYRLTDNGYGFVAVAQLIGLLLVVVMALPALRRRTPAPVGQLSAAAAQAPVRVRPDGEPLRKSRTLGDFSELGRLGEPAADADPTPPVETTPAAEKPLPKAPPSSHHEPPASHHEPPASHHEQTPRHEEPSAAQEAPRVAHEEPSAAQEAPPAATGRRGLAVDDSRADDSRADESRADDEPPVVGRRAARALPDDPDEAPDDDDDEEISPPPRRAARAIIDDEEES
ncbi:glycosyltransferase [Naumannella halotolerans]|nr:glycosyltransferase [Naumannella halotolerans]